MAATRTKPLRLAGNDISARVVNDRRSAALVDVVIARPELAAVLRSNGNNYTACPWPWGIHGRGLGVTTTSTVDPLRPYNLPLAA